MTEEKTLSKREERREKKRLRKEEKKRLRWERDRKNVRLLVPANKKGRHVMHRMNFFRVLLYPLQRILFPFKMYGHKKAADGAFIYVGNHLSMWDIFFPARTTWEGIHFLAKDSVLHYPVVGRLAQKMGVIGAMRDGTDVRTLMDAIKILKNGEKLALFPEGTRNRASEEEFLPFHSGAALLAIKTKTPVIPFVVCSRPRVFRCTHVVFGEPMELSEYYGKKMLEADYTEADEKLKAKLYALREEHRAMLREKKERKRK